MTDDGSTPAGEGLSPDCKQCGGPIPEKVRLSVAGPTMLCSLRCLEQNAGRIADLNLRRMAEAQGAYWPPTRGDN